MADYSDQVSLPDARGRNGAGKGSSIRKGDDPKAHRENYDRIFGGRTLPCGHDKIKYLSIVDGGRVCMKCEGVME